MDELEKMIREGLEKDGSLDPDKSQALKKQTLEYYDRALHKSERIFISCILFCFLTIVIAWMKFTGSVYAKQQIFCGVVMILGFLGLVFMGLLSFIINNRIGILKEIKMMRLGIQDDAPGSLKHPLLGTYARAEYAIWFVGVAASILIIAQVLFPGFRPAQTGLLINKNVIVQSDGSATEIHHVSFPVTGRKPLYHFPLAVPGRMDCTGWKCLDRQGRELLASIKESEDRTELKINLYEPAMPGEWIYFSLEMPSRETAKKEGDAWTFEEMDLLEYPDLGFRAPIQFFVAVQLPSGSEIISTEPENAEKCLSDNAPVVRFKTKKIPNQSHILRIRYKF